MTPLPLVQRGKRAACTGKMPIPPSSTGFQPVFTGKMPVLLSGAAFVPSPAQGALSAFDHPSCAGEG